MTNNRDKLSLSIRIMQAFALVKEAEILKHLSDKELIKILVFCDTRGFLQYRYVGKLMIAVACTYMIPKFDESTCHIIPLKDEGNILYVPWVVNVAEDKTLLRKLISEFFKARTDIKQIIFYKDDSKVPTVINRKGEDSGKGEYPDATKYSSVPARPSVQASVK